jgi:hypothetical protein
MNKMKRNLLILVVMAAASLFFNNQSWAACAQDPGDLGRCDTIYVETFDCDSIYNATGGYDSVRVAIYVTHDSNTFWWVGGQKWVQDSIAAFIVPLNFWSVGCADSVIFPRYGNWNNKKMNPFDSVFKRSMFRHLVDAHTGDTVYNRFALMDEAGLDDWNVALDYVSHDPGHVFLSMVPASGGCMAWWEGERTLLATITFLVYGLDFDCDSTAICFDSTSYGPFNVNKLTFTRCDAVIYFPRHFLPVCDTLYYVLYGDCNGDGVINSADVVYLINYLFIHGPAPVPLEAGDANCDGVVSSADVVYLINYLFINGPPPGC